MDFEEIYHLTSGIDREEFYGITNEHLFEFSANCSIEDDSSYLQIKSTELADEFIKICKKFKGASILSFTYDSGNRGPRINKQTNNLFLSLGAFVFFPNLRWGETLPTSLKMKFEDVSDFLFVPGSITDSIEIEVEQFYVEDNNCIFSCHLRKDNSKRMLIKSKKVFVVNFIDPK